MKRFLYALVASTLILSAGCSAEPGQNTSETVDDAGSETENTSGDVSGEASDDSIEERAASMVEPADAVLRCMVENNLDFAPDDDTFFWRTLYYFAGAYALDMTGADFDSMTGELTLPEDTMAELGSVLRQDFETLPEIPDELSSNVVLNDDGTYTLYTGDVGLSHSEITDLKDNGDGTYDMTVELRDTVEDKLIASGVFKIEKNEYVMSLNDPNYVYTIVSLDDYTRA